MISNVDTGIQVVFDRESRHYSDYELVDGVESASKNYLLMRLLEGFPYHSSSLSTETRLPRETSPILPPSRSTFTNPPGRNLPRHHLPPSLSTETHPSGKHFPHLPTSPLSHILPLRRHEKPLPHPPPTFPLDREDEEELLCFPHADPRPFVRGARVPTAQPEGPVGVVVGGHGDGRHGARPHRRQVQRSYTFESVEFNAFQGSPNLSRGKIQGYFSDKKHKNYGTTAPPSGLVRSLRDYGRAMRYLCDATFPRAIFTRFDTIFTSFYTPLMLHTNINMKII